MVNTIESDLKNKKYGYPEQGWLQLIILRFIFETPLYGYKLIKKVEETTNGTTIVKSGTMYTTLRRMEKQNLIKSVWEESSLGPPKRLYSPTPMGEEYLRAWLSTISNRLPIVQDLIAFYQENLNE